MNSLQSGHSSGDGLVLTEGHDLYVRVRRGVYHRVNRQGQRTGMTCSGFTPRPRWKLAKCCNYDARETLWCPRCGLYDTHYAMTGERSFCGVQRGR
jgi:hypothetical protein